MKSNCNILNAWCWAVLWSVGVLATYTKAELILHFDMDETVSPLVDSVSGLTAEATDDGHVYGLAGPTGFGNAVGLSDNGSWQLDVDESAPLRDMLNDFSVAAWVYLDSDTMLDKVGPNYQLNRIIGDDIAWDADGWALGVWEDGRVRFTKNGVVDLDTAAAFVEADNWYHVAATISAEDGVTIYVNGEEAELFGDTRNLNNGKGSNGQDDVYGLGRTYGVNEAQWVAGRFDDIRVYDTVLTAEEVAALLVPSVGLTGDYNGDKLLDAADLDLQAAVIKQGSNQAKYDLTGDSLVDMADRVFWVESPTVKNTYLGDANLDGEFNSTDFVDVFVAGTYETGQPAGWAQGDWNADLVFDSGDFVAAFVGGGYELGPRPVAAVRSVPEPTAITLLLVGLLAWLRQGRRR